MPDAIGLLLGLLDEAFERKAWHGPNLRGSLRGVSAAEAARRPAPDRHCIWEFAVHCAYWKYAVRRRLAGEKRGSFALQGSNWFRRPDAGLRGTGLDTAWRDDVALLVAEHRKLREVVSALSSVDFDRRSKGSRQTNLTLVRGIANHDLYHAGQIQLLKRLIPRR